ncbi:MAG TPA: alkaline phosphatase family protein [Terracidiphilus sp.]|nr:alkaline phosphatase family protein [Terracidiphilus sp.]
MSHTSTLGRIPRLFFICMAVLVPFLVSACSNAHTGHGTPPSVTISASPATIDAGATATLTVSASNASQVTVTGSDGSSYTLAANGGTQSVKPSSTTTYTATAVGAGGMNKATAVVAVNATSAPPTVAIAANPTSVVAGASSTLTVTAANATQVTVTGTDGSSYTLSPTGGTQSVSPPQTTTYTATATGAGGTVKSTATLTVTAAMPAAPPTVTITANPSAINSGSSATLTVAATNATQVTISGTDGSSYTLSPTGGTQSVSPSQTTTYTATATGTGGSAKSSVTVTLDAIAPPPTVTITANPSTIAAGSSSTLTVTATNATQVTISGTDGSSYPLSPTGGTQPVSPKQTTTYIATANGAGGSVQNSVIVTVNAGATVTITANPATIVTGASSTLTVTATNATAVTVTGSDGSSYALSPTGGTQKVSPTGNTTYTATATASTGNVSNTATVTVVPGGSVNAIQHVIYMMQENRSFDSYFGMLNPYRHANGYNMGDDGNDYEVDGLVDCPPGTGGCSNPTVDLTKTVSNQDDQGDTYTLFKFKSTCIDDDSSDWLASYGDVNRYDFLTTRPIDMDGFVHTAEGYDDSCASSGTCGGAFTDTTGERAMGYYDQGFLNYYYYMASQFALSDRWFSPVASKTIDNRIATMTGGTTQGLVKDPGGDDHLPQLSINNIFEELDKAGVSWKIYYSVTQGACTDEDECPATGNNRYPATTFSNLSYSTHYLYDNPSGNTCTAPTVGSANPPIDDSSNSFCIDPTHIAPLAQFFTDMSNNTLPSFVFIEPAYANGDEHPGSEQSILHGQAQVANIINAFMASPEWPTSVFFFAYDEGGGPYDHVPPVPGHSNDNTSPSLGTYPDISSISVNPDSNPNYYPCVPPGGTATTHCDLLSTDPGANPDDAPAQQGFGAQLGFRLPNMVISPFTRRHYVSHIPMDHTAIIQFVESRFIGSSAHLTARDAAQPNLLDFFDFNNVPWETPPTPPTPYSDPSGTTSCTPTDMGP